MSYAEDIRKFTMRTTSRVQDVVTAAAFTVQESITRGSALTGAPGQPVDTGFLVNSWILAFPAPLTAEITTNTVYAPNIEEGIGSNGQAITIRSGVGGIGSVKMTRAAWDRIVDKAVKEQGE